MIGMILSDRYEIINQIGSGGMAKVYKARCRMLNRFVAVKVLRTEFAQDAEFIRRFQVEAQSAASLSHPNVVSIYDVGEYNGLNYIVMEYVDGVTLKEYIKKSHMLAWQEAVEFSIQICRALEHAHKNGIVHQDIKPHNIMVTKEKVLKVTDFGIARASTAATVTMKADATIGSVHYFSPEQARGGYTDEKSDIYSLGVVMYEMMTGRLPFDGDSPIAVAIMHLQQEPTSPKEFNVSIPLMLENIVMKAIAKEQTRRYQSITSMLFDLQFMDENEGSDNAVATRKMPSANEVAQAKSTAQGAGAAQNRRQDFPPTVQDMNGDYLLEGPPEPYTPHSKKAKKAQGKKRREDQGNKKIIVWSVVSALMLVAVVTVTALMLLFPDLIPPILGGGKQEVEVPYLEGMDVDEVQLMLRESNSNFVLEVAQRIPDNSIPKNKIISQNPAGGRIVVASAKSPVKISVVVSEGAELIVLDDFSGKEERVAFLALQERGITPLVEQESSATVTEGFVVRTTPSPGATVKPGDEVVLYISSGKSPEMIEMPALVGLSLEDAKRLLAQSNLVFGGSTSVDSEKPSGTVLSQSVEKGTEVEEYTEVSVTVSNGASSGKITPVTTMNANFSVPQNKDSTRIKIVVDGVVVHNQVHNKEEIAFDVLIRGIEEVRVEVYHDDVLAHAQNMRMR